MRLTVPWSAIAAADLQPLAPRRQLPLGVAFAVPDPWQLLAANPDATLKARRMLAEDGWLSLPATALDVEPAVIVTAARAHLAEQPTIMA